MSDRDILFQAFQEVCGQRLRWEVSAEDGT